MRQMISGLVAAVAVVAAAPAMACGFSPCAQPQVYVAPVVSYSYSGCNPCGGGWGYDRLADPVQQYYFVNQGPTYTGPGSFAPVATYSEGSVSGWGGYSRPYGYRGYHAYRPYRARTSYYHAPRVGYGAYGSRYAPAPYAYGHRPLRRYY